LNPLPVIMSVSVHVDSPSSLFQKRLGTPDKFSFPNLETLYWYAAKNLTDILRGNWLILYISNSVGIPQFSRYSSVM